MLKTKRYDNKHAKLHIDRENNYIFLQSYDTIVAAVIRGIYYQCIQKYFKVGNKYAFATTQRHINEFRWEYGQRALAEGFSEKINYRTIMFLTAAYNMAVSGQWLDVRSLEFHYNTHEDVEQEEQVNDLYHRKYVEQLRSRRSEARQQWEAIAVAFDGGK